jgi:HSP20 family molecular chaperone IbpA
MAFFPRNFHNADASFTPLFRLLDDFDSYARQTGGQNGRRSAVPQWQPKFDVREVANAYELHGELPGISKENVSIEFTDPQTLLIRGRVERSYTAGTPPAGQLTDTTMSGAITEGEEHKTSRQATVEDEAEAEAHESGSEAADTPATTPATKHTEVESKKPADKAKYWLTERSIGEFSRSFNFPSRVEQDEVNASFKDGILTIVVPKAKKHESRRITVN